MRVHLCLAVCVASLCAISFAQQSSEAPFGSPFSQNQSERQRATNSAGQPAQASPQVPAKKDEKESAHQQTTGTSNDRLFWTVPNFLSVKSKQVPPLSAAEKFKVVTRGNFDPIELVYVGFLSGISQASNSEPGFGQGAAGYGKRFGATFADISIENFITGAILPSLLRQDPRFYQLGEGSFGHRTKYAIGRIFLTRGDSGRTQFNFSEVVGSALSAGISTYSYHPSQDRKLPNALSVWGTQVGWDTVTIVVKEFWPDVNRHFAKKRAEKAARTVSPSKQD